MKKHFCALCNSWVPNDKVSIRRHEASSKHTKKTQEAVTRSFQSSKLRNDKESEISRQLDQIEAKAREQTWGSSAELPSTFPKQEVIPIRNGSEFPNQPIKKNWSKRERSPLTKDAGPETTKQTGQFQTVKLSTDKRRRLNLEEE
jgi:hypothetical protein